MRRDRDCPPSRVTKSGRSSSPCRQTSSNSNSHWTGCDKKQKSRRQNRTLSEFVFFPAAVQRAGGRAGPPHERCNRDRSHRSEEHTSELQSHSFISYAVFCLKK